MSRCGTARKRAGVTEQSRLTFADPRARTQSTSQQMDCFPGTSRNAAAAGARPALRASPDAPVSRTSHPQTRSATAPRRGKRGVTPRELPRDVTRSRRPPGPGGAASGLPSGGPGRPLRGFGRLGRKGRGERWAVASGGAFPARRTALSSLRPRGLCREARKL